MSTTSPAPDAPDSRPILESAAQLYLVLTPDLLVVAASDAYLEEMKMPRAAVIGRPLADVILEAPAHAGTGVNTPVRDASGTVTCLIHRVDRDPESGSLLAAQARVRELESQAVLAKAELDAFNYSVSHDLRAPLRAIDGFSFELSERVGASLDETSKDYLDRVRAASKRMGALIEALLQLSRTSRGALTIGHNVDVTRVARGVVEKLQRGEPGRAVEITIDEGMIVSVDPTQLRALLEHVLGNAWKFTTRTPNPRVHLGWDGPNSAPTFFVRDNGAGFDPDYSYRLFAPFQRLHHERDFPGVGIGLATVARIVHRHGGTVQITAAPGEGTTISWTFGASPL